MSARCVVVTEVGAENPPQMALTENDDVIQAFSPDRSDDPFDVRILPRRMWGAQDFVDAHAVYALPEGIAVDPIAVAQQVARRGVPRKRFDNLLRRPRGRRVFGNVEMNNAATMVREHDEDEENTERRSGDREEINGHQVLHVIG